MDKAVKTILLLRHAKSAWGEPGLNDHDRPLNRRGERAARAMAGHLIKHGPLPDQILCSTAIRARQTLAPLQQVLTPLPPISLEKGLYLASEDALLDRLRDLPAAVERVMLIGHNDGIWHLAEVLAGGGKAEALTALADKYPTGTLAVLQAPIDRWSDLAAGAAELRACAAKIPMVWASNYSTGVNTLFWLTRKAAEILGPSFDLEVVEMHHRLKKDAPSGTATTLLEILGAVRKVQLEKELRHGRSERVALEKAMGKKMTYIPFKGGGDVAVQLVGKHIDSTVNNPIEAASHWKAGTLRALCVFDQEPMPYPGKITSSQSWKDVPTCRSQGLDVEYLMLRGIFMTPGASKDEVDYYVDLFEKVRKTEEWKKLMEDGAFNQTFKTGSDYAKWVETEEKRHEELMKAAGWLVK